MLSGIHCVVGVKTARTINDIFPQIYAKYSIRFYAHPALPPQRGGLGWGSPSPSGEGPGVRWVGGGKGDSARRIVITFSTVGNPRGFSLALPTPGGGRCAPLPGVIDIVHLRGTPPPPGARLERSRGARDDGGVSLPPPWGRVGVGFPLSFRRGAGGEVGWGRTRARSFRARLVGMTAVCGGALSVHYFVCFLFFITFAPYY
jgi:hypothetical protein